MTRTHLIYDSFVHRLLASDEDEYSTLSSGDLTVACNVSRLIEPVWLPFFTPKHLHLLLKRGLAPLLPVPAIPRVFASITCLLESVKAVRVGRTTIPALPNSVSPSKKNQHYSIYRIRYPPSSSSLASDGSTAEVSDRAHLGYYFLALHLSAVSLALSPSLAPPSPLALPCFDCFSLPDMTASGNPSGCMNGHNDSSAPLRPPSCDQPSRSACTCAWGPDSAVSQWRSAGRPPPLSAPLPRLYTIVSSPKGCGTCDLCTAIRASATAPQTHVAPSQALNKQVDGSGSAAASALPPEPRCVKAKAEDGIEIEEGDGEGEYGEGPCAVQLAALPRGCPECSSVREWVAWVAVVCSEEDAVAASSTYGVSTAADLFNNSNPTGDAVVEASSPSENSLGCSPEVVLEPPRVVLCSCPSCSALRSTVTASPPSHGTSSTLLTLAPHSDEMAAFTLAAVSETAVGSYRADIDRFGAVERVGVAAHGSQRIAVRQNRLAENVLAVSLRDAPRSLFPPTCAHCGLPSPPLSAVSLNTRVKKAPSAAPLVTNKLQVGLHSRSAVARRAVAARVASLTPKETDAFHCRPEDITQRAAWCDCFIGSPPAPTAEALWSTLEEAEVSDAASSSSSYEEDTECGPGTTFEPSVMLADASTPSLPLSHCVVDIRADWWVHRLRILQTCGVLHDKLRRPTDCPLAVKGSALDASSVLQLSAGAILPGHLSQVVARLKRAAAVAPPGSCSGCYKALMPAAAAANVVERLLLRMSTNSGKLARPSSCDYFIRNLLAGARALSFSQSVTRRFIAGHAAVATLRNLRDFLADPKPGLMEASLDNIGGNAAPSDEASDDCTKWVRFGRLILQALPDMHRTALYQLPPMCPASCRHTTGWKVLSSLYLDMIHAVDGLEEAAPGGQLRWVSGQPQAATLETVAASGVAKLVSLALTCSQS